MRIRFDKKIVVRYLRSIMLLLVIGILLSSLSAEAASKAGKAKKAYRSLLSSYKTNPKFSDYAVNKVIKNSFSFALCDITADGVPELILREASVEPFEYWIYTYHNGKLKKLKKMSYFNGGMICDIYPKNHVVCASEGDSFDADFIYYKLGNGKIKTAARTKGNKCYINGRKVSKSKYNKYIASLKKGKKVSEDNGKLKFRVNNAKNRNKFLK